MKFYPYPTVDDDQIFAAVGGQDVSYNPSENVRVANLLQVYICRPKVDAEPPFELLRWFKVGRGQVSCMLSVILQATLTKTIREKYLSTA